MYNLQLSKNRTSYAIFLRPQCEPSVENLIQIFPFSIQIGESNEVLVSKGTPIRNACIRSLAMNTDDKKQTVSVYGGEDNVASNNPPIGVATIQEPSNAVEIGEDIMVSTRADDRGYFLIFWETKQTGSYIRLSSRFLEYQPSL